MSHAEETQRRNRTAWLLGAMPVLVWSSVAPFLQAVANDSEPMAVSSIAITVGAFCSLVSVAIRRARSGTPPIGAYFNTTIMFLSAGAAVFLCLHYHLLYYILSTRFVVQANIINYLWPLFLFIFSNIAFGRSIGYSKGVEFVFMIISFLGVALIISTNFESLSDSRSAPAPKLFGLGAFHSVAALALGSAVSAAGYFTIARTIRNRLPEGASFFALPLSFAALLSLLVLPVVIIPSNVGGSSVLAGVLLGVFSVWVGNSLWVTATSLSSSHSFSSVGYFVPVIATVLLYAFGRFPLDTTVFAGIFLIVAANFLLHSSSTFVSSMNVCLAFVVLFGGFVLLGEPIGDARGDHLVQSAATIFALLSAFLLNRVWQRHRSEVQASADVAHLLKMALADQKQSGASSSSDRNFAKSALVDFYSADARSIGVKYKVLLDFVLFITTPGDIRDQVLVRIRDWRSAKTPSVSIPESMVILLLGLVTLSQVLLFRESDLPGDLSAAVFAAAIGFIVFLIHDYDRRLDTTRHFFPEFYEGLRGLDTERSDLVDRQAQPVQPAENDPASPLVIRSDDGEPPEDQIEGVLGSRFLSIMLATTILFLIVAIVDSHSSSFFGL